MTAPRVNRPSFDHWNYDETDQHCDCVLCRDYREARQSVAESPEVPEGHGHQCRCDVCRERRRRANHLVCVAGKRDLYSEMSWLTRNLRMRESIMRWVFRQTQDVRNTPYFWIHTTEGRSLGSWIEAWFEHRTGRRAACSTILTHLHPKPGADISG